MPDQQTPVVFDKARASTYDTQFARMAPMRAALDFLVAEVLSALPADARVLCVGAGTGAELISLAQAYPRWRFTALEPAAPMLDICRQRAEENGIASRCTFHEGYLDTLPASEPFDAATCLLVSHFFKLPEERGEFFRQIAARLRPEGTLVSADLVSDPSGDGARPLLDVWFGMMRHAGVSEQEITGMRAGYGRTFATLPPAGVAALIAASGFEPPTLFLQTLMIHAWYTRRRPAD